jgi:mRNA interferase RelE/StbE
LNYESRGQEFESLRARHSQIYARARCSPLRGAVRARSLATWLVRRPAAPPGRVVARPRLTVPVNLARMLFAIVLAPEAVEDLRRLMASVRATVRTALETHLRHEPEKASRSRIKRLRGLLRPQYRLRVGEVRVFYDVSGTTVEVLAVVAKSEVNAWLAQFADPE